MISTRAATISSPSGSPARPRALGVGPLLVWTLVGCIWFVVGSRLWAIDLDVLPAIQNRDETARDLEHASENVEDARAEAAAARERLDAFLSRHFDQRRHFEPPGRAKPLEGDEDAVRPPNPELAQLQTQLQELRAHRLQLLGYLTGEHPQVFDVDERIAALERQIAHLAGVATQPDGQVVREFAEAERGWGDYLSGLARQGEQDAAEYRRLYDVWQSAELAVEGALEAETAAEGRMESVARSKSALAEAAPIQQPPDDAPPNLTADRARSFGDAEPSPGAAEPKDAVTAAGGSESDLNSAGSQPLALAALLIALAVAALAAVRLARSTADPLFASADEAAAALAIPVVGIIPATAARLQRAESDVSPRRRWILLGQILLAVLAFAAIAYAVQNPGGLWRLSADPLNGLGSFVRAIGGGN